MSFNTSNIQADTFSGVYSISAPIHYVNGFPISKNGNNLQLGDNDNSVIECLNLIAGTQVSAPLLGTTQLNTDIIEASEANNVSMPNNNLDMSNNQLLNVSKMTLTDNNEGQSGQILGLDSNLNLTWLNDSSGDVSQWANYPAVNSYSMSGLDISNAGTISTGLLRTNTITPNSGTLTINGLLQPSWIEQNSSYLFSENKLYTVKMDTLRTMTNGNGTPNQILSQDSQNKLIWINKPAGAENWSSYDASNTINANGNGMTNLKSLTLDGGVAGTENQVLSVNNTGDLVWKTDANDVANWSNYSAVSNVDMGNNNIQNVNSIVCGDISTTSAGMSSINVYTEGGLGTIDLTGDMYIYNSNSQIMVNFDTTTNNINSSTQANLNGFGDVICNQLKPTFKPTRDFWVAPNGNDETGNGTQENPFLTIQHCIGVCEAIVNNEYKYIHLFGGVYNESLTITKKLYILGANKSPFQDDTGTIINGDILMNIDTTGNLFGTGLYLDGFLLNGHIENTSSGEAMLNCNNLYVYATDDIRLVRMLPQNNSRLRFTNCIFNRVNDTAVEGVLKFTGQYCQGITMYNCIVYNSGNSDSSCVDFNSIGSVDNITMCKFESSSTSASVKGIISVLGTTAPTLSFAYCSFLYSSTTNKSANANASGICFNNSSNTVNLVLLYCSFFLLGTTNANYAVQDLNFGSQVPRVITLFYMNNASLTNAFAIRGVQNTTKYQLQIVS